VQTLNIYNWATYIAPEVLEEFQKTYKVKIKYDNFDSEDTLYAKLKPGNPGYDVIFPSDYMLRRMIKEEMLLPLDQSNIPNKKHLDPKFVNTPYDPGNRYSMPYQWGTMGIGYNIKATGGPVDSWSALFESKYKNKVGLMDEMRGTLGMVLLYLGYSPSTTNPAEINKARDFLIQHKDNIKAFVADTGQDVLNQGEIDLTNEWSGDMFQVMQENPDLRYVIPKEGTTVYTDLMAIPKGAPHKKLAEQFINFILEPKIGATISNFIHYGSPNLTARTQGLINAKDLNNPAIYPTPEIWAKLKYVDDVGAALTLYDKAWTEVKAAFGS
jgi:spermidine/putrescine transport system substrate-binding protein